MATNKSMFRLWPKEPIPLARMIINPLTDKPGSREIIVVEEWSPRHVHFPLVRVIMAWWCLCFVLATVLSAVEPLRALSLVVSNRVIERT
jgi:hypothetical protein